MLAAHVSWVLFHSLDPVIVLFGLVGPGAGIERNLRSQLVWFLPHRSSFENSLGRTLPVGDFV
jgi:hypothetical protein